MQHSIRKYVMAAVAAALVCAATMVVKIPSPLSGYLHLGDGLVLLCGWLLSPVYAFFAAGLGSALADLFSGYALYALPTFLIKGVMAIVAYYIAALLRGRLGRLLSCVIAGGVAELLMIAGYLVFEGFMYGFVPSLVNIPANAVQGVAGLILGVVFLRVFERYRIMPK